MFKQYFEIISKYQWQKQYKDDLGWIKRPDPRVKAWVRRERARQDY